MNNPATIRSWQRARSWVGRISPPGVLAFREYDSINVFDSGGAAFNRLWVGTTITSKGESRQIHWRNSLAAGKVGYTSVPGGSEGWAGTLGGSGLAVSRRSVHPKEAIELVRFMIRSEIKSMKAKEKALASQQTRNDLSSASNPHDTIKQSNQRESSIVSRPSSVVGGKYEQVARGLRSCGPSGADRTDKRAGSRGRTRKTAGCNNGLQDRAPQVGPEQSKHCCN